MAPLFIITTILWEGPPFVHVAGLTNLSCTFQSPSAPHTLHLPPAGTHQGRRSQVKCWPHTPPSILRHLQRQSADLTQSAPAKPAIPLLTIPVWGFYNCTGTGEFWLGVQNFSRTELQQILCPSCQRVLIIQSSEPFLSRCPSFPLWYQCPITGSEGPISLPKGQTSTAAVGVQMHAAPSMCTPCVICVRSQTTVILTGIKTHVPRCMQEGSRERGAAAGQRTYFAVPLYV